MSNKEKTSLVPKLRFPEFLGTDSWGKKKLFDILNPAIREVAKPNSNYLAVGIRSYGKGTFHKPDQEPEKNSMDRLYLVHRDDLIVSITFAWEGAIAIAGDADHGAYVSHRFPTYEFKSSMSTPAFFRYVFSNSAFTYKLTLISPGGAGRNRVMNKKDFLEISVAIPSLLEQQKIADCLSSLDQLIAAQARKVDALKTHKDGLMQQLFPREGETQPRLRFPEFRDAGEWKQKTLEEIATIKSGSTPLRANDEFFVGGSIPWVKTTDLNNSFIATTEEKITTKAKARINPVGSVLVAMYGGFNQIGRTGCLTVPAATNQAISVLMLEHKVALPVYVLAWLNAKVEDWKRIASSSRKDPNITGSDVAKFPITLPDVKEQKCIADSVHTLDNLIAAATQELETLKIHKKGLMQQIFPSAEAVEA